MLGSMPDKLRFKIRKGDFEVELEGTEGYVRSQYERLLTELGKSTGVPIPETTKGELPPSISETPKTASDKLKQLRDEGFFKEPKDSGSVVEELRNKGWGVYVSKDISSALKRYGPKMGLRRVPVGKGRYSYTYP